LTRSDVSRGQAQPSPLMRGSVCTLLPSRPYETIFARSGDLSSVSNTKTHRAKMVMPRQPANWAEIPEQEAAAVIRRPWEVPSPSAKPSIEACARGSRHRSCDPSAAPGSRPPDWQDARSMGSSARSQPRSSRSKSAMARIIAPRHHWSRALSVAGDPGLTTTCRVLARPIPAIPSVDVDNPSP
jgi:hypothetical protein